MQATETLSREKAGAATRLRASLGRAPAALSELCRRGATALDNIVALVDAVDVAGEALGEWADAVAAAGVGHGGCGC